MRSGLAAQPAPEHAFGASNKERTVKLIAGFLMGLVMLSGCASGNIPHADGEGAAKRDAGPMLCHDGSTPPCNDRD
jgi:hypothetical protein